MLAEAGSVETKGGVEVGLERRLVGRAEAHVVVALQAVSRVPDRLAQPHARPGEEPLPGPVAELEDGVAGGAQHAASKRLRPVPIAGDPVRDEDVVPRRRQRRAQRPRGSRGVVVLADRAQQVPVSVPEQSQHAQRPLRPDEQRDDRLDAVAASVDGEAQLAPAAVVPPPQLVPLERREDVRSVLGQPRPVLAEGLDPVDHFGGRTAALRKHGPSTARRRSARRLRRSRQAPRSRGWRSAQP